MKHLFKTSLLAMLLLGSLSNLQAQPVTNPPAEVPAPPATTVEILEPSHDFGAVVEGTVPTHTFKFKNTGNNPLIVENVKPACGCTTPKWSNEPVAPGGEGYVTVEFNSKGRLGLQQKSVTITFANTEPKFHMVNFKVQVNPDPNAPAPTPVPAPTPAPTFAPAPSPAAVPVDGHDHGHDHAHDHAHDHGTSGDATVAPAPPAAEVVAANDNNTMATPVPLDPSELTTVQFMEESHDFGTIKEGDKVTYRFVFKNTGKKPLIVENVKPSCGCTTPEWTKEPIKKGKKGFVEISFDSKGKMGVQKKSVTVTFKNTDPKNKILAFSADVKLATE